jgi:predicted nucleic acid-binding protein
MIDRFFVDTNVLLYRFGDTDPAKRELADDWFAALWRENAGRLSWQVIFEFYSNAIRKTGAPPVVARAAVNDLAQWNPATPHHAALQRAWHWCDTAQINFWDALIVAAAEQCGCRWLLSEDFQADQRFGGVTVVNPFRRAPAEFKLSVR